jgi:hypothetical protein
LNAFVGNVSSWLTNIKMSFGILPPSTISFHLSNCFYELTSAGLSLSLIQMSYGRYYKRMVFHLSELACVLLGYSLMKMPFNNQHNHRHKVFFYRGLSNVSRMMNSEQKKENTLNICKAVHPYGFSNVHLMISCMKILSYTHLFHRWKQYFCYESLFLYFTDHLHYLYYPFSFNILIL